MLKELKFVQGAVAKKDLLPAMTHFAIEGGHVRSYNGTLALSSPIPFDIDCKPKAGPLVQAIANCNDTVTLSMTPAGKLRIQSGKFWAFGVINTMINAANSQQFRDAVQELF